jgi:hypothetical protein
MGPTTPVSPVLFDYWIDLISGTVVEKIETVMRCLIQGGLTAAFTRPGRAGHYSIPRLRQYVVLDDSYLKLFCLRYLENAQQIAKQSI